MGGSVGGSGGGERPPEAQQETDPPPAPHARTLRPGPGPAPLHSEPPPPHIPAAPSRLSFHPPRSSAEYCTYCTVQLPPPEPSSLVGGQLCPLSVEGPERTASGRWDGPVPGIQCAQTVQMARLIRSAAVVASDAAASPECHTPPPATRPITARAGVAPTRCGPGRETDKPHDKGGAPRKTDTSGWYTLTPRLPPPQPRDPLVAPEQDKAYTSSPQQRATFRPRRQPSWAGPRRGPPIHRRV